MEELISVIVPVYKVKKFLNKCVDSIINQTYKNLEIILVDDGCPEGCGEICDEYAKIDNRVKVVHKVNGGPSSARNCGLDLAKGEYIAFVDSDDYIENNYIEKLYKVIVNENADMVMSNFNVVDFDGKNFQFIDSDTPARKFTKIEYFESLFNGKHVQIVVVWGKLYKSKLFENIRFEVGKIHEDDFIFHKIIDKCENIFSISDKLYNYVRHVQSIMGVEKSSVNLDCVEAFIMRTVYFKNNNMINFATKTKKEILFRLMDYLIISNYDKSIVSKTNSLLDMYKAHIGIDKIYFKIKIKIFINKLRVRLSMKKNNNTKAH